MPPPRLALSDNLYETAGLTLIVFTSDEMPWKRPTQAGSYAVFKPNGVDTAKPAFQRELMSMAKNIFGTIALLPASPPLPVRAGLLAPAMVLPLFVKLVDGPMKARPIEKCFPRARRAMPAGFQ